MENNDITYMFKEGQGEAVKEYLEKQGYSFASGNSIIVFDDLNGLKVDGRLVMDEVNPSIPTALVKKGSRLEKSLIKFKQDQISECYSRETERSYYGDWIEKEEEKSMGVKH